MGTVDIKEEVMNALLLTGDGFSLTGFYSILDGILESCHCALNAEEIELARKAINNKFDTYSNGVFTQYEGTKFIFEDSTE